MADFRNIHTRIWTDSWFSELEPDEKLLFIYLFSNPSASICGLYEMPMRNMAMDTGISLERVTAILDKFSHAGKVYYENGLVWVVNLKKYNDSGNNVKVQARIKKELDAITNCPIKEVYCLREKIPYPETRIPYPTSDAEKRREDTDTETDTETSTDALSSAFTKESQITPYNLDDWGIAVDELVKMGANVGDVRQTTKKLIAKNYKILGPWSIVKSVRTAVAERKRNNGGGGTPGKLVIDPNTNRVING